MTLRVIIAEDAEEIAEVVAYCAQLAYPDCEVQIASNGQAALQFWEQAPADLVILDVTMPPSGGLEVCQQLRKHSTVPIMMLSAHAQPLEKVRAYELGADDYVTKPFDNLELIARMRALLRRTTPAAVAVPTEFVTDGFVMDFVRRSVHVNGAAVALTVMEYHLLQVLVENAGVVVEHQQLLAEVWGPRYEIDTHYLKGFIRRLRQKLGDNAENPRYIYSERGVGYRFVAGSLPQA